MDSKNSDENSKHGITPWYVISLLVGIIGWLIIEKVEDWDETIKRVDFIEDV